MKARNDMNEDTRESNREAHGKSIQFVATMQL